MSQPRKNDTCTAPHCGRPATVRGFCASHYGMARRRGLPVIQPHDVPLAKCGTRYGYQRHLLNAEPACDACKAANAAHQREYQARRRLEMD